MSNYNIPNCNIQRIYRYFFINSNRIGIKRTVVSNINDHFIDMVNDVNDSFDYIEEFLLLNMFLRKCEHGSYIYYNNIKGIIVSVYVSGYCIHYNNIYKSQKFLEIMREKLGLNDVNKLVIKE